MTYQPNRPGTKSNLQIGLFLLSLLLTAALSAITYHHSMQLMKGNVYGGMKDAVKGGATKTSNAPIPLPPDEGGGSGDGGGDVQPAPQPTPITPTPKPLKPGISI